MENKIKKQCKNCGKDIFAWPYQKETKKYCSRKCSLVYTKVVGGYYKHKVWNKGLKGFNSGSKNPSWKGGKQKFECLYCGAEFLDRKSESRTPKFCQHKCFTDYRKKYGTLRGHNHPNWGKEMLWMIGENNSNWKGGSSKLRKNRQSDINYLTWRRRVFDRDNYICQLCGNTGVYLEAHHIHPWANFEKERYLVDNGITYCKDCHIKNDKFRAQFVERGIVN